MPEEQTKWQWMDNHHGPMGWFSDEDKKEYEGTVEFRNGTWRRLSAEEVATNNRALARLYYEQS